MCRSPAHPVKDIYHEYTSLIHEYGSDPWSDVRYKKDLFESIENFNLFKKEWEESIGKKFREVCNALSEHNWKELWKDQTGAPIDEFVQKILTNRTHILSDRLKEKDHFDYQATWFLSEMRETIKSIASTIESSESFGMDERNILFSILRPLIHLRDLLCDSKNFLSQVGTDSLLSHRIGSQTRRQYEPRDCLDAIQQISYGRHGHCPEGIPRIAVIAILRQLLEITIYQKAKASKIPLSNSKDRPLELTKVLDELKKKKITLYKHIDTETIRLIIYWCNESVHTGRTAMYSWMPTRISSALRE